VVRGYSTLSAGVHTLPFAVGAAVTAPIAARLALRFGPRTVVSAGLLSMALGFAWASTLDAASSYWGPVVGSMLLLSVGLTLTTAPATESIMGSLPREKAGVGSAVNDTTRELGGTLGVAVIGSVFSSVYGPRLGDLLSGTGLPPSAVSAAKGSVVAAAQVAEQAPAGGRAGILEAARSAFLDGMAAGTRIAALAALVGVALALAFLPDRFPQPADAEDVPSGTADALEPVLVDAA
jgi:hypothetical protein